MSSSARAAAWPAYARTFLSSQSVSLLGDGLALLAVPLLVLELSRSPLVSGIAAASVTIGYLCFGIPAGVVVDRVDPWRLLIAMDALRAVVFAVLFVAAAGDLLTVGSVLALSLVAGGGRVFFETALTVVIKDLFPGDGLIRANSVIEVTTQFALVFGPVVVAALAATLGLQIALLANAVTFLVSLAGLIAVRRHAPTRPARSTTLRLADIRGDFREGLQYLLSIRLLVVLTALQMVVNLGLSVEKLLFFYAKDTVGLSTSAISGVVAVGGVGGVLGAVMAPRLALRFGHTRVIAAGITVCGLAVVAMSAADSFAGLLLANMVYLWAVVAASVVNRTQRQRIVCREMLGRVTGTVKLLFLAVDPVGVFIAGSVTAALGGNPRPVFVAGGLLVTAAAVWAWCAGLRAADDPEPPS
ncbi:MFS transporter [Nocardia sienata]|uniref:MFS transporter n=1 Tax=Nocardia sienata TaxID=248552 RepID=UPI0007A3EA8A|nr:MFS transporter [Nocardia sienata]